jgi:Na+/phosphate symporter
MAYEMAIAVSTVLISFIFIYISTFLDREKYPGLQFMFFALGLLFIVVTLFTCVFLATDAGDTDLINMFTNIMNIVIWIFVLVVMFFMFKFVQSTLKGMNGEVEDEDD